MASKRSWEGHVVSRANNPSESSTMAADDSQSAVFQSIFETFRGELDEHHDRRERIIKASRDITALSKKMYVFPPPFY
jgi:hypothetical protein